MKQVRISDVTLREGTTHKGATLSFKEKIEIAKLLDKLGVDVIEMAAIENVAADTLLLKSLSSLLKKSTISVVAGTDKAQIEKAETEGKAAEDKAAEVKDAIEAAPEAAKAAAEAKAEEVKEEAKAAAEAKVEEGKQAAKDAASKAIEDAANKLFKK